MHGCLANHLKLVVCSVRVYGDADVGDHGGRNVMGHASVLDIPFTRRDSLRLALGSSGLIAAALAPFAVRATTDRRDILPTPRWDVTFAAVLADTAGYAYAVARDGQVVARGAAGFARLSAEGRNPDIAWETGTRINLASVSKTVTAVAIMALVQRGAIDLAAPFHRYLGGMLPTVGAGVDTVTVADLLAMQSGLAPYGTLYTDGSIADFLGEYLQQPLAPRATPGVTYAYSNTNFTILQAVVDRVAPTLTPAFADYADYVSRAVLAPMGVDTTTFSPRPDPRPAVTLSYGGADDARPGAYWAAMQCIAPGGWVASADELIAYAVGVRNNAVLAPQSTGEMLTRKLGWYAHKGAHGIYYHHNGGLDTGGTRTRGLSTGIVRFTDGYDAVLLVNTPVDGIIRLMIRAFEASPIA